MVRKFVTGTQFLEVKVLGINLMNKTALLTKLRNWCLIIFSILVVIYFFVIYILKFNDSQISTLTNVLTAFATFTAACTAIILYNDWREQARYELEKEIINQLWNSFIELKIILVALKEDVDEYYLNHNNSAATLYAILDKANNHITRYYYYQQKFEIIFGIEKEDLIFNELELIMKSYMYLLVSNNQFNHSSFTREDEKLIKKLNDVQPIFYKKMADLMLNKRNSKVYL